GPPASEDQVDSLASKIEKAIAPETASVAFCSFGQLDHSFLREAAELMSRQVRDHGASGPTQFVDGSGFVLIRSAAGAGISTPAIARIWDELPQRADIHPDVSDPIVIGSVASVRGALRAHAGDKHS